MKGWCCLILIHCLSLFSWSQSKKIRIEDWELKGPVKFFEEYSYDILFEEGKIEKERDTGSSSASDMYTLAFNEHGMLASMIKYKYTKNDRSTDSVFFAYNDRQLLIREERNQKIYSYGEPIDSFVYNKEGDIIEFWEGDEKGFKLVRAVSFKIDYDSDNRIITKQKFDNDTLYSILRYEYYASDSLKKKTTEYLHDDTVSATYTEFYNKQELVVRSEDFDPRVGRYRVEEFKYDLRGNKVEYSYSDIDSGDPGADVHEKDKKIYAYDASNNLIETMFYRNGNIIRSSDFQYDADNRLLYESDNSRYSIDPNDKDMMGEKSFIYDAYGNLIWESNKFRFLSRELEGTVKEYIYDKHGNWIECLVRTDGLDPYIVERTIIYYE